MSGPVSIRLLKLDPELEQPSYAHGGDAGADLRSRVELVLQPGQRALVPTGIAIAIPDGFAGLVHPRSGLAARHGITIVNAPGVIDSGYRGEVFVNLLNTDQTASFHVHRGDRIAQLLIQRVELAQFEVVTALEETARGVNGHGSTGGFTSTPHTGDSFRPADNPQHPASL